MCHNLLIHLPPKDYLSCFQVWDKVAININKNPPVGFNMGIKFEFFR